MTHLDDLPSLALYQEYAAHAEKVHGWDADTLTDKAVRLAEETGELCRAIRRLSVDRDETDRSAVDASREIADAFNVLLTIANRLGVDVGEAFAAKHRSNGARRWVRHPEGGGR